MTDSTNKVFSKTLCLTCRMDQQHLPCTLVISSPNCSICRFDMADETWYEITPCTPQCTICPNIECLSYLHPPFDYNFPDLTVRCQSCNNYCRYVYSKKGVTIKSVNLEFVHNTARNLERKVCCLINPAFPFRQTDRHCKRCVSRRLNQAQQQQN